MKKRHVALWGAIVLTLGLLLAGCRDEGQPTPTSVADVTAYPGAGEQPDGDQPPGPGATPEAGVTPGPADTPGGGAEPPGGDRPVEMLPEVVVFEQPPAAPVTAGTTVEHMVSEGEWLVQIARCYGVDYADILRANAGIDPNFLDLGDTVTVPDVGSAGPILGPPCTRLYQVAQGDTFQSLAEQFQTSAAALQGINPGPLFAGREIIVPVITPLVTETILPPQDMLFNYNGNLALWRSDDGQVAFYPGESRRILNLTTGERGRYILIERTVDAGATAEIGLIDRQDGTLTILEQGLAPGGERDRARRLLVTPDEAWAAYVVPEGERFRVTWLPTSAPERSGSFSGLTVPTDDPRYPQLFADQGPNTFLWVDRGGIYRVDPAADAPRQLLAVDSENTNGVMAVEPMAWSPDRDLLLVRAGFIEGYDYQIFDPLSGTLVPLPKTGSYVTIAAASWTGNGQIAVLAPPVEAAGPELNIYQPLQADGVLSVELLYLTPLPVAEPLAAGPGYVIAAPLRQPVDGALIFYLKAADSDLWLTTPEGAQLTRLNGVPDGFGELFWSTDGRGVIFNRFGIGTEEGIGDYLFIPLDGGPLLSLRDWLGIEIGQFHWVGEAPVTALR